MDNKTFVSITYTNDELSIVCPTDTIPSDIHSVGLNSGWKCIKVEGPLDFSLTGILSKLVSPLAEAKISIFAISTFDTDYLMVKEDTLDDAIHVLTENGHSFKETLQNFYATNILYIVKSHPLKKTMAFFINYSFDSTDPFSED